MENTEAEKAKNFTISEFVEYGSNLVVIKSIIDKNTGNIRAISVDSGKVFREKIIPFDTFIQIIDGKAEIIIDDISNTLETGQSIIVPAHYQYIVKANECFKMILTVIKSGYE
jgi:quercetin dioxygenase-like cupin family protein